ncbi:hypothetical protein BB559_004080 [Furculomyces boomerangus]|uniref:O-acyltransferase n=2 Tax=Harpellales TaxID=61421 RepID=A0A2T9YGS8_9FUNG|nr:hypothetical protein BB559_004080 [Furculomyces boomerangus]PVZ97990.1 hypothetical protein BB558_006012 [Smittium angustum]
MNDSKNEQQAEQTSSSITSSEKSIKQKKVIKKAKNYPQAQIIHREGSTSLLDVDGPPVSFSGLVNLAMLLLGGMMIRLILENYLKYGILVTLPGFDITNTDLYYAVSSILILCTNLTITFQIEKSSADHAKSVLRERKEAIEQNKEYKDILETVVNYDKIVLIKQFSNLFFSLAIPSVLVYNNIHNPIFGTMVMMSSVIVALKIYSYTVTNLDLRRAYICDDSTLENDILINTKFKNACLVHEKRNDIQVINRDRIDYTIAYPNNIALPNILYFLAAPTLCYQPSYPRSEKPIRWKFVAKRTGELLFALTLTYVSIQQYGFPTLINSMKAIETNNQAWVSERVLKLSVVVSILWLIGFYAFFHSWLNIIAELLGFADRRFYLAWWNSSDLGVYWREWNLPIHNFCKRHIMVPITSPPFNLNFDLGVFVTFFISAVLHELLFGIPTRSLKLYSFWGMLFQLPLIKLTEMVSKSRGPRTNLGNSLFWIFFCIIGQPLLVLRYYYNWVQNNREIGL